MFKILNKKSKRVNGITALTKFSDKMGKKQGFCNQKIPEICVTSVKRAKSPPYTLYTLEWCLEKITFISTQYKYA